MKFQSIIHSLESQIESSLNELGFNLVELRCFQSGISQTIRITINDPNSHVGHKQCILASKALRKIIPNIENYNLEVFSPGIGRELKSEKDFEIFKGKLVEITFTENKQIAQIGILKEKTETELVIIENNEEKIIPVNSFKKVALALAENKENITEISVEDI